MSSISKVDKQKLLDRMRQKQAEQSGFRDLTEWRAPKLKSPEEKSFRVIILPPLEQGDPCVGGTASESMDLYYRVFGYHLINKKRYECPRVHPEKGDCPLCSTGFDLMKETDDKKVRSGLAKEWLSQQNFAVNIYFENHKDNPEDLRGKVFWWSLPNAVQMICDKAFKSDDAGDDDNPKAHGLFFDPNDAFPLIIEIKVKNDYNNYEGSKFLGKSRPIAATQEEIDAILAKRHDVMKKFEARDIKALEKLLQDKLGGTTGGGESSGSSSSGDEGYITPPADKKEEKKVEVKTEAKVETKTPPKTEEKKTEVKSEAKAEVKTEVKKEEVKKAEEKKEDEEEDPELKALLAQLNDK
jgi:hypothetical protein